MAGFRTLEEELTGIQHDFNMGSMKLCCLVF